MIDIVERLRKAYGPDHTDETIVETLPLEAADEIERLRRESAEARAKALEEAAVSLEGWRDVYGYNAARWVRQLKDRAP